MVFAYTAMGVLCVEHANVLELCYIELLSGDGSPYSILSDLPLCLLAYTHHYSRALLKIFNRCYDSRG